MFIIYLHNGLEHIELLPTMSSVSSLLAVVIMPIWSLGAQTYGS